MMQHQIKLLTFLFDEVDDLKRDFEEMTIRDGMFELSLNRIAQEFKGRTSDEYTKLKNKHLAFQKECDVELNISLHTIGGAYRHIARKHMSLLERATVIVLLLPDEINPLRDEEAKKRWET